MSREYITKYGKKLGYTSTRGNRVYGFSSSGKVLGYYSSNRKKTFDGRGNLLSDGNILSHLIMEITD
jgi:hypothetical protein